MSYTADQLLEKGVALKRQGRLEEARKCYVESIHLDPANMMTYISLGKTAYLLGNQILAIKCYLASSHLQIGPIEQGINDNNLPFHLTMQYEQFTQDFLLTLPKKSAFTIFIDPNTPRHVSHALVDLSTDTLKESPNLRPYADIYRSHILGDGSHNSVLQRYGLNANDQLKNDEDVYIPHGRKFLLQELEWDKINNNNVLDIYFN